jgi:hypothetical protein
LILGANPSDKLADMFALHCTTALRDSLSSAAILSIGTWQIALNILLEGLAMHTIGSDAVRAHRKMAASSMHMWSGAA